MQHVREVSKKYRIAVTKSAKEWAERAELHLKAELKRADLT
jgi:hypothetical protein